jgi:hypothetical protein
VDVVRAGGDAVERQADDQVDGRVDGRVDGHGGEAATTTPESPDRSTSSTASAASAASTAAAAVVTGDGSGPVPVTATADAAEAPSVGRWYPRTALLVYAAFRVGTLVVVAVSNLFTHKSMLHDLEVWDGKWFLLAI